MSKKAFATAALNSILTPKLQSTTSGGG